MLQKWYNDIKPQQKLFMFGISYPSILFYGIGIIPSVLLTYLELGAKNKVITANVLRTVAFILFTIGIVSALTSPMWLNY